MSYEDSSINCPTVEHLHKNSMIAFIFAHNLEKDEINQVAECYEKVFENLDQLR